jgi:hypothetical protein
MQRTLEWVPASRNLSRAEQGAAAAPVPEMILGPDAWFGDPVGPCIPVCAAWLAGDWRRTLAAAAKQPALGWSSGDNAQALVLPMVMAWFAGWPARELPEHLSAAFAEAVKRIDDWESVAASRAGFMRRQ